MDQARRSTFNLQRLACVLIAAAVAFIFYAPALRFGFFNDDPTGHFRWMAGRQVLSFFVDAGGHGYYRPVSFALWQALYVLLGRHDPFVLHLLNVIAHAANAALVCWLGCWLAAQPIPNTQSLLYGCTAGLLFALYPFSYEAVPYVGSFVHPLVTLFILLTLTFYLAWRAHSGWGWFVAAHIALTLAVFTQENGVIAPLLILALEFLNFRFQTLRLDLRSSGQVSDFRFQSASHSTLYTLRSTLYALSFLAEPVVFAVAWLLAPKLSETGRVFSLQTAWANVLPFVQALIYPVAPLAQRNLAWLVLIAAVALAALYLLARALRRARLLAFGVLVWALAALPSILFLDHAYVTGSPRLFYLGSVGAALVWALPILISDISRCVYSRLRFKISNYVLRFALYISLLVLYLAPFAFYLLPYTACQLRYQGYAGQVGQMMAAATRGLSAGQSATFVNLPYFFGSRGPGTACPQPFAFAPTGAVVIPPYADAGDFAFYNGGANLPTRAVTFDEYAPGWTTHGDPVDASGLRAALADSHLFVFDLVGWQLYDLSALWQPSLSYPATPSIATLGGAVQLSQSEISRTRGLRLNLKSEIVITLTWQVTAAPQRDYRVFTQLLDASGKLVGQHDGSPANGLAPTRLWQAGDRIVDVHIIPMPGDQVSSGGGRIIVGMYDPATGARLQAFEPDGARLPGDAIPLP